MDLLYITYYESSPHETKAQILGCLFLCVALCFGKARIGVLLISQFLTCCHGIMVAITTPTVNGVTQAGWSGVVSSRDAANRKARPILVFGPSRRVGVSHEPYASTPPLR